MTKDEALRLALEALELHGQQYPHMVKGYCLDAITAIKEVLAQHDSVQAKPEPESEPVAWTDGPHLVMRTDWRDRANYKGPWVDIGRAIPDSWVPVLYTTPPQNGYAEEKNT